MAWVKQYQTGKTSLDLNEARDDGVLGYSGISWTTYKQSAPRYRQITTPTPHQWIFTDRMLFLMPNQQCQSTEGTYSSKYISLVIFSTTSFGAFSALTVLLRRMKAVSHSASRSIIAKTHVTSVTSWNHCSSCPVLSKYSYYLKWISQDDEMLLINRE